MSVESGERKVSVYIALSIGGAIAAIDLIVNQSVEASSMIVLAFIGFAGGRQLLKSTIKR